MSVAILIVKRLAVWVFETIGAAVLIAVALTLRLGEGQSSTFDDLRLMFGLIFVLIMMATGYLLTVVLFGVIWRSKIPWVYPMIAAVAFVLHTQFFIDGWTFKEKFPVQVGGACIVFACCYAGNWCLKRWSAASLNRGSSG